MNTQPKRARRCQLSVPGSSEKMMTKAAGLDIDHVFLDLEDAVAPSAKPGARGMIVDAINNNTDARRMVTAGLANGGDTGEQAQNLPGDVSYTLGGVGTPLTGYVTGLAFATAVNAWIRPMIVPSRPSSVAMLEASAT